MPTVTNTVLKPNGAPAAGARVRIRLIASDPPGAPGFVGSTDSTVVSESFLLTTSAGVWTAVLAANSLITPASTVYEIVEDVGGKVTAYYVVVPNGAGPYWAGDILSVPPIGNLFAGALELAGPVSVASEGVHPGESIWYGTDATSARLAIVVEDSTYEPGDAGGDDYADNAAIFSVRSTNPGNQIIEALIAAAREEGSQATASAFVAEADTAGPAGGPGGAAYAVEAFAYATNGAHAAAIHGVRPVVNVTGNGTVCDVAYGVKIDYGRSGTNTLSQLYGVFVSAAIAATARTGVHVSDHGSGSSDWNIYSAGATSKNRFEGRTMQGVPNSAPSDADIANGQFSAYLDQAGNALKFRVRYSDGTLKTGTLALA